MTKKAELFVKHILGVLILVNIITGEVSGPLFRTILLLKSGSTNYFDTMWNSQIAINDPYGNYSLLETDEDLADIPDFKVAIDPSWGVMNKIGIIGLNDLGDELFHVSFDVTGQPTANVSDWFIGSYMDDAFLLDPNTLSTVARNGTKELIIMASNECWFSILHSATVDPKIVLSVNSSGTLSTGAVTDVAFDNCWADWELDLTFSFMDETGLTVESCALTCDTTYVALQLAKNCFCTEFISTFSPVAHMCTEVCPGNVQYKCGSVSEGYFAVYSATKSPSLNQLDSLPDTPDSVPLLTLTYTGGWNHTINISTELVSRGWTDDFIYVDKISVNATNSTGHIMLYSFLYWLGDHYKEYEDDGNIYFDTDGIPVDIHVILLEGLQILYEWDVVESKIQLYGPSENTYVDVPMIAVFAQFGNTTTTTTTPTVSGTTSTGSSTDAVTTSISTTNTPSTTPSNISSLYYVFENQSILVNGTMYCPCNETITSTGTPNLTSIYSNTNKTFEELIADLTLDADTLSSNTRRYKSATDNRASATTLGTAGIVIIVSCISFIVYLDSARLILEATKIKKNYKILKKRLSKRSLKVEAIQVQCIDDGPDVPDILK